MVICLEQGADCLHVVQLMPLLPKTPSSLASFKSRLVLHFLYRLHQVVLEKRPLIGCCNVVGLHKDCTSLPKTVSSLALFKSILAFHFLFVRHFLCSYASASPTDGPEVFFVRLSVCMCMCAYFCSWAEACRRLEGRRSKSQVIGKPVRGMPFIRQQFSSQTRIWHVGLF